ncbi:MAG: universal stress protein [Bacteroidetes bacterium]|nr:universal stress protein [Bacteroidota bacterium]
MKTILVPIDFSQNSENALRYSIILAEKWKAKLILFHSFHTFHSSGHLSATEETKGAQAGHRVATQELTDLYAKFMPTHEQTVEYLTSPHELLDEIIRVIKDKAIDLVVMGTQGIGRLAGKFLGTNASWIVEYAPCPVIVVPETKHTYELKHISYASQYLNSDIPTLKTVAELAGLFQADLSVVHVTPHETVKDKDSFLVFEQKVLSEIKSPRIHFKTLPGSSVEETLETYLKLGGTDLLVMSAQQRDFLDKVFRKSITQILTLHLQAPIMVFHHQKE